MTAEWYVVATATLVLIGALGFRWWWALARAEAPPVPGSKAQLRLRELEREILGEARTSGSERSGAGDRRDGSSLPPAPALLDGAITAGTASDWMQLDERFFAAVGQLSDSTVEVLADAQAAVESWDIDGVVGSAAAFLQEFKGHLGTQIASAEAQAPGAEGELAESQVGKELFDAETSTGALDFGSLQEHFASLAGIPALIPAEVAALPEQLLQLAAGSDLVAFVEESAAVAVEGVSNAAVTEVASEALEFAAGQVGASFPLLTAGFAVWREGRLVRRGHTDVKRAGKNVLVDTAAVGTGSALGAQLGAVAGTALMPGVGTAIGAFVGGTAGALLGRTTSNRVKGLPLQQARSGFERAASDYATARDHAILDASATWQTCLAETEKELRSKGEDAKRQAQEAILGARGELRSAHCFSPRARKAVLDDAERELEATLADLHAALRGPAAWRRVLWPQPEQITARRYARAFARHLGEWKLQARALRDEDGDGSERLLLLVVETRSGERAARALLHGIAAARVDAVRACEAALADTTERMVAARKGAADGLQTKRSDLLEELDASLTPSLRALHSARDLLEAELRKAGKAATPG